MKKLRIVYLIACFIFAFDLNAIAGEGPKIQFWSSPQKGTNIFNQKIKREDIKAAKAYGFSFIRLSPDKFLSQKRDYLIGNADHYTGLVPADLQGLKNILDMCEEEGISVILTMLSLPGSRWKQNNHNKDDLRLWNSPAFQAQTAQFWKDLARELKDHPAIIGYNILNEPHPERLYDKSAIHIHVVNQSAVQKQLFDFYALVIQSIRAVDAHTPIILDSSSYGDPQTFRSLKVHKDPLILYSFHIYEPYAYTNAKMNKGQWHYPGTIQGKYWDQAALRNYMKEVERFQKINHIPAHRILVGEFGGNRLTKGLPTYFKDLITIFREKKWHFAFYAFREDMWDGMDYELGDKKLPWSYWKAVEKGETPVLERKGDTPLFKALREIK